MGDDMKSVICQKCGTVCKPKGIGTGYGVMDGKTYCYDCCGIIERDLLIKEGKGILYLSWEQECELFNKPGWYYPKNAKISNWPGTFSLPIRAIKVGSHNFARRRYDVWFKFNDMEWHGVSYGDNTQLCHVRRLRG